MNYNKGRSRFVPSKPSDEVDSNLSAEEDVTASEATKEEIEDQEMITGVLRRVNSEKSSMASSSGTLGFCRPKSSNIISQARKQANVGRNDDQSNFNSRDRHSTVKKKEIQTLMECWERVLSPRQYGSEATESP